MVSRECDKIIKLATPEWQQLINDRYHWCPCRITLSKKKRVSRKYS